MQTGRKNILLIDDESDYSDTMGFYLRAKGHNVRTAQSGRAGIEEIKKECPDIVFLDFMMPEMNGVETLKGIRGLKPLLPVIMVTSYASDELMEEAASIGISSIFQKADDFSLAARLIQETLEGRAESSAMRI
ncbi:MAG: response regulator [Deltaproteobacteria bacterium]|nr:response regulator [Deltaproteobacteria bacterium]